MWLADATCCPLQYYTVGGAGCTSNTLLSVLGAPLFTREAKRTTINERAHCASSSGLAAAWLYGFLA